MQDSKEVLREAVRKAAVENRLTCEKAHELGRQLDVPLQEIGAICNELNIRIKECQLGCF
jgi:hypothetical protein